MNIRLKGTFLILICVKIFQSEETSETDFNSL